MILQVLDPTNETMPLLGRPAPRLNSLAGKTVGFISNGKEGTQGFFAHLDRMLRRSLASPKWSCGRSRTTARPPIATSWTRSPAGTRSYRYRRLRQLLVVQSA